jgi:hypothetical protein
MITVQLMDRCWRRGRAGVEPSVVFILARERIGIK